MSIKFNYYYGKEAEQFSFFRIPKLLFIDPIFSKLSSDAKVLYGILLDRMSLSMKNEWLDEANKVYIIFTIEEVEGTMNFGRNKAINTMKELENFGLIEKKRRGLGKPNIIYVKNFLVETKNRQVEKKREIEGNIDHIENYPDNKFQEVSNINLQKFKNQTSRSLENKSQEVSKTNSNNTNINKTEYSDTEYNNTSPISPSKENKKEDMEVEEITKILKQNINYTFLVEEQLKDKEKIDLIVNLMAEAIQSKTDIRINQKMTAYETVKEQFLSLQKEHISYVLLVLDENKRKITNLRAYLLSLLYNAPINILGMTTDAKSGNTDYSKDKEIWQQLFNTT
mgnify:CR=1 FL=1